MSLLLLVALALGGPYRSFAEGWEPPESAWPGQVIAAPVPHWQVQLPGPRMNAAAHTEQARPVVVGGDLLVGSAAGRALYRLDRRDGSLVHTYPADASVESEPLVVDDRVLFGDTGGRVWCYTLEGALVWSVDTKAPILVRPTRAGDVVFVTNVDDLVVALDLATGSLRWRYQQKRDLTRSAELALYAAPPALVIDGEVIVGFSTGDLVALSEAHGDLRWSIRVGEGRYPDLVAEPAVEEGLLFVSGYFQPLQAIERATRRVRWSLAFGAAASPLLAGPPGDAVLYHPGSDGRLRAIDAASGDVLWTWESGSDAALTAPQLTEAGLLVGSSGGSVSLVDPISGVGVWSHRPTFVMEGVNAAPVVDGRQILFVSNSGRLYSMLSPQATKPWPAPFERRRPRGQAAVSAP